VTTLDWIAVAVAFGAALVGLRRGLLVSALSLAGVGLGAIVGGRVAPHLLPDGAHSPYTPLVALAGALVFAFMLEGIGAVAGGQLRGALPAGFARKVDSAGGLVLGAVTGLAVVWVLGAVALQVPGQRNFREAAQRSAVLRRLNELVPPRTVLRALARVDPFPALAGPAVLVDPPDPRVLREPGVLRAAPNVVRIYGTACGLGIAGSGWVARDGLVVTAAHVVAGESDTTVVPPGGAPVSAEAVVFDARNDLAVLRAADLEQPGLPVTAAHSGDRVAILGYPQNGPFTVRAGRIGSTLAVAGQDAYGRGPIFRTVTSFRGRVRHGNSGGPVVNERGEVEATVFASRPGSEAGYGVPTDIVRRALARADGPVSTGDCAP
jgi:S1-C subfamily serine protease